MTVRGSVTGSMTVVNLAGDMIGSRIIVALSEKVEIEAEGTAYSLERLDAVFQEDEGAIFLIDGVIASLVVL